MSTVHGPAADELSAGPETPGTGDPRRPVLGKLLGAVALVVAAAVLGPGLLSSSPSPDDRRPDAARPSASSAPTPAPEPTEVALAGPLTWPIRGDLASDEAFVDSVLAQSRRHEADVDGILYAGALPDGGRLALLAVDPAVPVSPADGYVDVLAVHIRADQQVTQVRPKDVGSLSEHNRLVGWAGRGRGGRVNTVVLGPPGELDVEVSAVIDYHPTGEASRSWWPISSRDGAATLNVGKKTDPTVVARPVYTQPGMYAITIPVGNWKPAAEQDGPGFGAADVEGLRDRRYGGPEAPDLVRALSEVTSPLFDPAEARWRVLWSGRLVDGQRSALVRARRPDGASFQVLVHVDGGIVTDDNGREYARHLGAARHVPWETADLAPWAFQSSMDVGANDAPLLLLNPSGAGTALIKGDIRRTVRFDKDGVAVLTSKMDEADQLIGGTVTIRDPAGRRIVRTTLASPLSDDPFVTR